MTHALCWHDQHGGTQRAQMTRQAADRFARVLNAIFPNWPVWTEAAPIQEDDACSTI